LDEAADVLGVSSRTVMREWNIARAWLYGDLKERHGDDAAEMGQD